MFYQEAKSSNKNSFSAFFRSFVSIIFLLLSNFTLANSTNDSTIDLNLQEVFIKYGFDISWTTVDPSEKNDWQRIPANATSKRSIKLNRTLKPDIHESEIISRTSSLNLKKRGVPKNELVEYSLAFNFDDLISNSINKNAVGLFLSTIGDNWQIYLNGKLIEDEIAINENQVIEKTRFLRDVLVLLPEGLLRPTNNLLVIRFVGSSKSESLGFYAQESYLIGEYQSLTNRKINFPSILISFSYLFLAIFFLLLFLRRTKNTFNLVFGLSCLFMFSYFFARTSSIQIYLEDSKHVMQLEYASLFIFSSLMAIFFDLVLGYRIKRSLKIYFIFSFSSAFIILLIQPVAMVKVLRFWQVAAFFPLFYVLIYRVVIEMFKNWKKINVDFLSNSFFQRVRELFVNTLIGNLSIGSFIFVITAVLDIVSSMISGGGKFGFKYGFFIFMASNAAVLINRFINAQIKFEDISENLENQVKERTKTIEETNLKLVDATKKANSASQAKADFLANMSHEIRTPINGVIGTLRLLNDTPLNSTQKEYTRLSKSSADALLSLVNDILDFSKIEAGKLELENFTFQLNELMDDLKNMVGREVEEKGVDFKINLNCDLPLYLKGDANRLRQVLLNLSNNAKKFTQNGCITINVSCPKEVKKKSDSGKEKMIETIQFSVKDTGIGIGEAEQQKLFNQFTQADRSTTRRFGGTGLGLAISKQLVTAMGGEIGVNSRLGDGSEFWFSVPLEVLDSNDKKLANHALTNAGFDEVNQQDFSIYNVLVAEDNKVNQLVIVGTLNKLGINADVVSDGEQAIKWLTEKQYHIVLMDIQMPVMDGIEATKQIRNGKAGAQNKDIAIIAVTANVTKEDIEACEKAGMNGHISKPIMLKNLVDSLSKWLKPIS